MNWFNKNKRRIKELEKDNYFLRKRYSSLVDDDIRQTYVRNKLIDELTRLTKENRALERQVSELKEQRKQEDVRIHIRLS